MKRDIPVDMRRGTPPAFLFGGLLYMIRTLGIAMTMQQVADKLRAPAATVSQIEKGQRALKEPKIAAWAAALNMTESDLRELWVLSQGLVPVGDDLVVYTDATDQEWLSADIRKVLLEWPDLEPIYRHACRIAYVLRRALPYAQVNVDPDDFSRFQDERDRSREQLGEEREDIPTLEAAFVPLPFINCYEDGFPRYGLGVPLLRQSSPIVRRPPQSVDTLELEDLIRELSYTERQRVRGYVEAILQERTQAET